MNMLDKTCPYCGDTLSVTETETDFYGTLYYGECVGCNVMFVQMADYDEEWEEAADDYMDYDDFTGLDGAFRE